MTGVQPPADTRIVSLDGLRGIAVLLVFLDHASVGPEFFLRHDINLAGVGRAGVFLFFILSSYLLSTSLLRSGLTARYFLRRVLRIAPLYYAVLLGLAVYQYIIGGPDHYRFWMIHVDGGVRGFIHHFLFLEGDFLFWTIPVEMESYLLLPVWLAVLQRSKRAGPWLLGVGAAAWAVTAYLANAGITANYVAGVPIAGSLNSHDVFVAGTLLAWVTVAEGGAFYERHRAVLDVSVASLLVLVLAVTACMSTPQFLGLRMVAPNLRYNSMVYGVAWCAILYSVANGNRFLVPILRLRWLRTIGVCGYSWYLLHVVVLKIVLAVVADRFANHTWINLALALVATYFVCQVTYRLIERPFLRLGARQSISSRSASGITAQVG